MRSVFKILAVVLLTIAAAAHADEPFAVEVIDVTPDVLLGNYVSAVARIANVSGKSQPTAYLHATANLKVVDGPPGAMHCLSTRLESGPWVIDGPPEGLIPDLVVNRRAEVPAGWSADVARSFLPPEPGEYTVVVTFSMTAGAETRLGEPDEHWQGEVSTAAVKVRVVKPQGVDAEVFDWYSNLAQRDCCCSRARRFRYGFMPAVFSPERMDFIQKFPDSVYTAEYVMHELLQKGSDYVPPENLLWRLKMPIGEFHARIPCPPPERCLDNGTIYLGGADYIAWKLGWCERILEQHPDVWFADEVRFWEAFYRCRLGDTEGCEADLLDLAENGRLYGAEKGAELLVALQAEGFLEKTGDQ